MTAAEQSDWYVYILRCTDDTLYTGITNDINRRVAEHNRGVGAKYTRGRTPVKLVFTETLPDRSAALRRELAIKRMKTAEKQLMIKQAESS
ncbi:MAG: GIY-YIG nuclease family protein [Candidatus Thiodiazotropha sp. (ex. Lucinisca nassula)]|nr:GIY-YIG nuclease family protein [Candidatus Thiodiazotropha sp. (ex. Lucinisca nassula)]MBW9263697.1 GIY-YIG nuclease family protein [Candidatus Thiodiazotropha sp. (ex. Lucinisca nassula)]MBW9269242.1 GIY-YIG nuclease family protein [Candidatus Thiodiazotropha sp. (ex. Lucinisca nassula)]